MGRRESREHLFCMLFLQEFHEKDEIEEQLTLYMESLEELKTQEEQDEIGERLACVMDKLDKIDSLLEEASKGWRLSRMGRTDLSILRLAVYEMEYDDEIPVKVAINEAVELAKKFGEDQSPAFINGILAKFVNE